MRTIKAGAEEIGRHVLRRREIEVNKAMTFSWDDMSSRSISIHFDPVDTMQIREKVSLWFDGLETLRQRLREARRTGENALANVQQIHATSWIVKTNPGYVTREGFKIGGPGGEPDPLEMSTKLLSLYNKKRNLLLPEHQQLDPCFAWISVEDFINKKARTSK